MFLFLKWDSKCHTHTWNFSFITLSVVLHRCETWSLTLREEHRLRVFENRLFGPTRDEVTGGWRGLYNGELHNAWILVGHGENRNACRLLVGVPEGRRTLGRPSRSWVNTMNMDLGEIEGIVWIGLIWLKIGTNWGQFILQPTVSRPVRLGVGLPFGAHDQILSLSFL
jgi:hypothetical protein